MPWIFAKQTPGAAQTRVILLAGRRVGYCLGMNEEEGKVCLLVTEPRLAPGGGRRNRPRLFMHEKGTVQAFVKAPFQFLSDPLGQRGKSFVPEASGWAYLTLKGWVDEESRTVEQPWEISER